jgi:hypothetical protein
MRKIWTTEDDEYMRQHFADTPTHEIAAALERSYMSIAGRSYVLGLKKSEAFKAGPLSGRIRPGTNLGGHTKFTKGSVPWNKGKKMPKGWGGKTRFKKGQLPHNTAAANGVIRQRRDKSGRTYLFIRVALAKWELYHQYLWKQHHGPIPRGHIVVFKDKDSLNCVIENLEMITLEENMLRNTIHNYPKPIALAVQKIGVLNRKINRYEKQIK